MITVATAIFEGYERPKSPPSGPFRKVLLTDDHPDTQDDRWEIIRRRGKDHELAHGVSPRRLIFTAKLTPHVFITDEDDVVWIDGSMEPRENAPPLEDLVAQVPPGGVGAYEHHGRDGYWAEAEFSHAVYTVGGGQDRGLLAMDQAAHYEARGCPRKGRVWATGILVWRGAQRRLGAAWLAEVMAWSASDQIALPWLAHLGHEVTTLPGDVYESPWFEYVPHGQEGRTTEPRKLALSPPAELPPDAIHPPQAHPSLPNRVRSSR